MTRPPLTADGAGRLFLGDARYLLVRPETLVGLQKALERALGEGAGTYLVAGGRAGGAKAVTALAGAPADRVRRLIAIGGEIGWGSFMLEELTPSVLVVTVHHSPFAEAYGPAPAPVCHLLRGVLEALAESVLEQPAPVRETLCVAMGATVCRFEARA